MVGSKRIRWIGAGALAVALGVVGTAWAGETSTTASEDVHIWVSDEDAAEVEVVDGNVVIVIDGKTIEVPLELDGDEAQVFVSEDGTLMSVDGDPTIRVEHRVVESTSSTSTDVADGDVQVSVAIAATGDGSEVTEAEIEALVEQITAKLGTSATVDVDVEIEVEVEEE